MNQRPSDKWEDLRFRVLRLLEANPELTQRDLARELGIGVGLVNYCLRALLEKGLIKYERFRASQNKLRYAYVLTPAGLADRAAITTRFLQRQIAEYERLQAEIEALRDELRGQKEQLTPVPSTLLPE